MLIHHFLERSAASRPDAISVVHEKNRASYADVNKAANQVAHALIGYGVKPGDRVVLICENSVAYIIGYYGILKSGGISVSLNPEMKATSIEELLNELEPKALIVSSKYESAIETIDLGRLGVHRLVITRPMAAGLAALHPASSPDDLLPSQSGHDPDPPIDPHSCAMIVYTSGSVGKPKGVMLTHANVVANTRSIIEYLELTPQDIQMVVLPFFYVMGKSLLNTHMAVGGRVVINNQFAYTASVLKQMVDEGVTGFSGVPSTYAQLLFKSPLAQYRDRLPALRYCSQAGGHMPKHIKLELLKILPAHTRLVIMYGATEASARLTFVPPEKLSEKIDSIGIPISGVRMSVLSADGTVLGPGEIGELVARGDNIMTGYYRDGASTRNVLDTHGYHTGDLGFRDEDGFFYVTGRKDSQLKIGGHRINPQEIEDVIIESGQAAECVIFGIPDPLLGHRLEGFVIPARPAADVVTDILKFCRARLPKHKVPESLMLIDAIPKNSSGKIDRNESVRLFNDLKKDNIHA
jgi:long-chain acyl-CoA synthetase